MSTVPRPEHPRPQFVRASWVSLNGEWEFTFDPGDSGLDRGLIEEEFNQTITVPFCPESTASGIGDVDFHEAVWYRREVPVPTEWQHGRVLLHFGAVDYDTTCWVNGLEVGRHRGGYTSFSFDITSALRDGAGTIVVRARDSRHGIQPRGKQATWYENSVCHYTRVTGIWQTVWLEGVPDSHLQPARITPMLHHRRFELEVPVAHGRSGQWVSAELRHLGELIASADCPVGVDFTPTLSLEVPQEYLRVWCPEDPYLYELTLRLHDVDDSGRHLIDEVSSYAGMRSVAIVGPDVMLNGRKVFQRLVLDQGWWPDTLMTAPSDEALKRDIELAMAAGFNGARLHQRVPEQRLLHHADTLGYLLWEEFADWGCSAAGPRGGNQQPTSSFVAEWLEVVTRDYSHPSVIGWCPLNETHQVMHDRTTTLDDVTQAMFWATKAADRTRPVIDASGYSHRVPQTDVWDSHDYTQNPSAFEDRMGGLADGRPFANEMSGSPMSVPYAGQPYFCSEYGGIWWVPEDERVEGEDSWGYGERVANEEEFYERLAGLTRVLDQNPLMFGYCYTQLTDVFQEQNGIYRFDRAEKFDIARVRSALVHADAYTSPDMAERGRA